MLLEHKICTFHVYSVSLGSVGSKHQPTEGTKGVTLGPVTGIVCYAAAPMRVGSLEIDPGALLAPMEAVTDLPFRTVCEELGAALTFTEFLSAEALTRGARKALDRMWPSLGGRRFAVQIFGREPAALARAAEMAVDVGASIVDINMGCPAKKVTAGMCGSALMREPALAAGLVEAVRKAVPAAIPVTVKHRTGWDESSINAAEFARLRARLQLVLAEAPA